MLFQLVGKEMKYQLKNITLYLFLGIVLLFYFTQFDPPAANDALMPKIEPNVQQQYFGFTEITDPVEEIRSVYKDMYQDWLRGDILKKGFIINKNVRLSEEQLNALKKAMNKIYPEGPSKHSREQAFNQQEYSFETFQPAVSYDEYLQAVRELDKALGGSTYYSDKNRKLTAARPMTYEEALESFELIKEKDKITGAYARVFADYMGIVAGFFPVFIAAFLLSRDQRSRMQELIYSREANALEYVGSKYIATCILMLLCFTIAAVHATYSFYSIGAAQGYEINMLAFFKYTLAWVLPTLMFTVALGMLVSVVLGNGIAAIVLQFILWTTSMLPLIGDYSLTKLVLRFNELGQSSKYMEWLPSIITNRIFYTIFSLVLVIAAAFVWEKKRGAINGRRGFLKISLLQR